MTETSVIICAHNPRPDFLGRVLEALKGQTLPLDQWEFLLIDNASREPLASAWNLSWHPRARHIREDELGLTPSRLRGIRESSGEVLVFVDDDNVLRNDFLAHTVEISGNFPFLGAWGGQVDGEFEQPVPDWLRPRLHLLAVRNVDRDYWANYYSDNRSMPFGAGLCVRKQVAAAYASALKTRPESRGLGRKGASLVSAEDIDIGLTAYDCGFGTGLFARLRLTHLIPKGRMTAAYVCRLMEGIEYSSHLLRRQRNSAYLPPQDSELAKWVRAYRIWRLPEPLKSFAQAEKRGLSKARAEMTSTA
ncbi:MAG: glycosyltransferase [Verrucomicrobiota bacterium]|jgi:glycosyltransferase involved in cell wall biosynthesis